MLQQLRFDDAPAYPQGHEAVYASEKVAEKAQAVAGVVALHFYGLNNRRLYQVTLQQS